MKARDRAIGILLGVLLGIGIVTAFVFFGSEGTIDAPRIDQGPAPHPAQGTNAERPQAQAEPPAPRPNRPPTP